MKLSILCAAAASFIISSSALAETLKVTAESAEAGLDSMFSEPIVTLKLKPASTLSMGEFTKARVGEQIKMRLGDRVLMEPVINEPILQGTLVINVGADENAARELADAIMKAGGRFEIDGSDK
jgi:preprotein translocase subunit SecD